MVRTYDRNIQRIKNGYLAQLAACLLLFANPAQAQDLSGDPLQAETPVLLQAQQIDYDTNTDIVVASGGVEITNGDTILIADSVLYDRARGQMQAMGNIKMLEPSGNVMFADSVALSEDLQSGVIHQFKARLQDDALFVANSAKKIGENNIHLFKAAYTPCRCEKDGESILPTWSLHAEQTHIDQEAQRVEYKNAYLKVLGVPALYTPYFSHPTPDAENQSGLLMPEFLQSRNLGAMFKQPVYYAIAPDKDLTVTPIFTTQEGLVVAGNYRQRFDSGALRFNGSLTNVERRDDLGDRTDGREFRGHVDTSAAFRVDDYFNWGFDVRRASDETYLRLYNFGNDPFLNSRIYGEGTNFIGEGTRTYGSVEALAFQGLSIEDASAVIPIVAPLVDFTWQSQPLVYNSRLTLEAGTMALFRDRGAQSRRVSSLARWNVPYVTDNGQVLDFEAQLRTDIYAVDGVRLVNGDDYEGTTGRFMPQMSLKWRYPLISRYEHASILVEPTVQFIAAPNGGNPEDIPNEDSLLPDFNDANLFSTNRFAGYDRVESGPRVIYGAHAEANLYDGVSVNTMIGQQYRFNSDPNFPTSNDRGSDVSDYVGRVGMSYEELSASYRFRINQETLASRRNEIELLYSGDPLAVSASYLKLKNDPVLSDREIANGLATLELHENWALITNGNYDLRTNQTIRVNGGIIYKNECVNVTTMVGKDYTNLLDIQPSLNFWVRVSLKSLD